MNYLEILDCADSFAELCTQRFETEIEDVSNLIPSIPLIVNLAFAIELYLKAILCNYKTEIKGHNWLELYKMTPFIIQESIEDKMKEAGINDFETKISEYSGTFADFRYIFEHYKPKSIEFIFLFNFFDVLKCIAHNLI